jgi:hypothetical protein
MSSRLPPFDGLRRRRRCLLLRERDRQHHVSRHIPTGTPDLLVRLL